MSEVALEPHEPNWKNWKRVITKLKAMKETEHRKFAMSTFITLLSGGRGQQKITAARMRHNGPECGSAACLFGNIAIWFAPPTARFDIVSYGEVNADGIVRFVSEFLNIDEADAQFVFQGRWNNRHFIAAVPTMRCLAEMTRAEAIEYLEKALAEKKVRVTI